MIDEEILSIKEIQKFLNLKTSAKHVGKTTGLAYPTVLRVRDGGINGNYNTNTLQKISQYIKKELNKS